MHVWKKPGLGQRGYLRPDKLIVKLVNGDGITHVETESLITRITNISLSGTSESIWWHRKSGNVHPTTHQIQPHMIVT